MSAPSIRLSKTQVLWLKILSDRGRNGLPPSTRDALEARGLISPVAFGTYQLSEAGKTEVKRIRQREAPKK